jgi:hypothetical protein
MSISGKIFNEEKVLYFADRDAGLHVQRGEPRDSDLNQLIHDLAGRKLITQVSHDGTGFFYRTTREGSKRLLMHQIEWRKAHGKDTSAHDKALEEMQKGAEA